MSITKESYEERQAVKTKLEALAAECQAVIKSLDECGKLPLVAECDRLNDELRDVLYNSAIGRKARPWAFIILEAADPAEATRLWELIHANPGPGSAQQAITLAPVYPASQTEQPA